MPSPFLHHFASLDVDRPVKGGKDVVGCGGRPRQMGDIPLLAWLPPTTIYHGREGSCSSSSNHYNGRRAHAVTASSMPALPDLPWDRQNLCRKQSEPVEGLLWSPKGRVSCSLSGIIHHLQAVMIPSMMKICQMLMTSPPVLPMT